MFDVKNALCCPLTWYEERYIKFNPLYYKRSHSMYRVLKFSFLFNYLQNSIGISEADIISNPFK